MIDSPIELLVWLGFAYLAANAWIYGMAWIAITLLRHGIRLSVQPANHW